MPRIRSLPRYEPEPGTNPLRAKAIQLLLSAASDPTGIEVGPLGMTRMLKGTKAYHGTQIPERVVEIHPEVKKLLGDTAEGKTFRYFDPGTAGSGAGGNLYGEGIYLTEHPGIARGYAGGEKWGGTVRTHNIPPQAKILDVHAPMNKNTTMDFIDEVYDTLRGKDVRLRRVEKVVGDYTGFFGYDPTKAVTTTKDDVLKFVGGTSDPEKLKELVTKLGYDGIVYDAGQMMGLPPGVPEGTKNYVIYNYDIINNPRKVAAERMPKRPKKTEIKKLPPRKEYLPDEVHPFEMQQLIGGTFSGKQPFTGASATQNINKRVEALKNALESGVLDDVMKKKGIWIP